jgi:uncharacterized protein YndB with AHSA1/START domain
MREVNPNLDLVLERVVDVPRELVWTAWTTPEHLKKWFTPVPWQTVDCEIDLRPGGAFRATMQSPEGEQFPYTWCYLEVVPNERLVWTDALLPGYRPSNPSSEGVPSFTAILTFEAHGQGTKYTAVAMHRDEAGRAKHEEMGVHEGWETALDQLVAVAKTLQPSSPYTAIK